MACVALTSLIQTVELEFLQPTPRGSLHHDDDEEAPIKSFLEKLSSLQAFLQDRSSDDGDGDDDGGALRDLEIQIRDFALKTEDDIELQLSKHRVIHPKEKKRMNKIKRLNDYMCFRAPHIEYPQNASHELRQTLGKAAEIAAELLKTIIINKQKEHEREGEMMTSCNATLTSLRVRETIEQAGFLYGYSHRFLVTERRMVGRHHDCRVIKNELFSASFGLKIIAIVGMMGIGKTTLARYVYEDPSVASRFRVKGWVTIPPPPQHYNKRQMLSKLLQSIKPEKLNVITRESTLDELEIEGRKRLHCMKYLIVFDNIMSSQAWTDIRKCVPDDKFGSCILVTTRHFNQYTYWNRYVHHMTLLNPKKSWELFCNTLSIEEQLAPKFERIRNHVVEKCDGLPQLIVEVAKRISKCNNIQQGWKKIEKELESLGFLDHNALMISHNMLPPHLKVCFLYFGVFPKRKRILVKMLIRLWTAERFVKPMNQNELEDEAYMYLQELIDRNLLLIEDRSFDGKIKTCRMHSAMHSFCVVQAQKEGILCAVNTQQHSLLPLKAFANSCRWLSLYSHSFDYYVLFGTNISRSIFFFHENPEMFVPPKLLRVLAFDTSISLQRVPLQLGGLVFLRYLCITQWFEDLNDVMSNNPNLETFIVSGNGAPTVHLPSSVWKPPHLKHLELGNSCMVDPPSADKKNYKHYLAW